MNYNHVKGYPFPYPIEDLLDLFQSEDHLFLLHSSQKEQGQGRFSILGFDPFDLFRSDQEDAVERLRKKFHSYQNLLNSEDFFNCDRNLHQLPFFSGIVGFWGYDIGLHFEGLQQRASKDVQIDSCFFGFYDCVLILDHHLNRFWIQSSGLPEKTTDKQKKRAEARTQFLFRSIVEAEADGFFESRLIERTQSKALFDGLLTGEDLGLDEELVSNFSRKDYLGAVKKALRYIEEGEIYQVNLSQRFQLKTALHEFNSIKAYQLLSHLSPSSFGGYFDGGAYQIICSSPERFLSLKEGCVKTRPMKGTSPRSADPHEDLKMLSALINSKKEKAELLMITDLLRNDLGRVCEYGSVKVKQLRHIERYKTVFQATAQIEGRLSKRRDAFDLLKACLPGGSITGCPKIRAMEVIDELEPTARSLYTGSLGYIDFSGNMDFNILIRTLLHYQNSLYFQVGGGIVYDSIPEREYEETLIKARAIKRCLNLLLEPSLL